jgi:hypothetical protein
MSFFHQKIVQSHDVLYIEPARDIATGAPKNQFVIYWQSDNLKQFETVPAKHPTFRPVSEEHDAAIRWPKQACKVVQIALANDHLMFNDYEAFRM